MINDLKIGSSYRVHKIKSNTFLIETDERKYIVKTCNYSILSRIWYNFKNGKPYSFKNEIIVRKQLDKINFSYFRYPKLLRTDGSSYMIIEFIEGKDGWRKDIITNDMFVASLLEFQFSGIRTKNSIFSFWNRKIPIKVIRWSYNLITPGFDIVSFIKSILLALRGFFIYKEKEIITHNDLFQNNNLITGNDENIYFYDFEFTTDSNQFFLIDIIDLCFDMEKLTMNIEMFKEYISQLSNYIPINRIIRCIEEQTRIIILRKLLGSLKIPKLSDTIKDNNRKFIKKILLSVKMYRDWFNNNIAIAYEGKLK